MAVLLGCGLGAPYIKAQAKGDHQNGLKLRRSCNKREGHSGGRWQGAEPKDTFS